MPREAVRELGAASRVRSSCPELENVRPLLQECGNRVRPRCHTQRGHSRQDTSTTSRVLSRAGRKGLRSCQSRERDQGIQLLTQVGDVRAKHP